VLASVIHCSWVTYQTGGCWPRGQPTLAYNEESGFLSIVIPPLLSLLGIVLLWAWHQQCHVSGCYWPARRLTAANERTCWRHSPHPKRTVHEIHAAHHAAAGTTPPPR
jgi:hypothetical protein